MWTLQHPEGCDACCPFSDFIDRATAAGCLTPIDGAYPLTLEADGTMITMRHWMARPVEPHR